MGMGPAMQSAAEAGVKELQGGRVPHDPEQTKMLAEASDASFASATGSPELNAGRAQACLEAEASTGTANGVVIHSPPESKVSMSG